MTRNVLFFVCMILISCSKVNGDVDDPNRIEENMKNNPSELSVTAGAENITEWSATLIAYANPTPEMSSVEMGILYSTEPDPSLKNGTKLTSKELDSENRYKISVSKLASETTYYYKSFVLYGGVYRYGKVKSFKTKTVSAVITTYTAENIGYDWAVLKAGLKISSGENLPVTVSFLYGDMGAIEDLESKGRRLIAKENGEAFTATVYNLTSGETFCYLACAKIYDKEIYGTVKTFKTEEIKEIVLTSGEAIDMGLSVKWRSYNLGASRPEEYGDYYAWGETSTKTSYNKSNYTDIDHPDTLPLSADAARANLGGKWRMPTVDEFDDLIGECNSYWLQYKGVNGRLFESKKNGNTIFLPAAGGRYNTELYYERSSGYYWSSSLDTDSPRRAWYMYIGRIDEGDVQRISGTYWLGYSVRPVTE